MNLNFNMSFIDLGLPASLTTTSNDPIKEFFEPALGVAVSYDIAVGYFSSSWIRDASKGIAMFAKNGGHSRWVISPQLSQEDWSLLSEATLEEKGEIVESISIRSIEELQKALEIETRKTIGWLIFDRILEFKLAVPKNNLDGIFHAKMGILKDVEGNKIAFSGSYNLTKAANTNWEHLDVFSSWIPSEAPRVAKKEDEFERIWDKLDPNLEIYFPTDRAVKKFVEIVDYSNRPYELHPNTSGPIKTTSPAIPQKFLNEDNQLRPHQEEAISKWFNNNGRGILHMATGSGKTVTALSAIVRFFKQAVEPSEHNLMVVITVPYKHLADQWDTESRAFGFVPLVCYGNFSQWLGSAKNKLMALKLRQSKIVFFIVVNATFMLDKFQSVIDGFEGNFLFVADEMHNLGGNKVKNLLPGNANFRMGLSATPERHYDEDGTKTLQDYFGRTLIEYGIDRAIVDGTLCPYYYHVVLVDFTEEEMDEYIEISNKISRLSSQQGKGEDFTSEAMKYLLIARGRLVANAENKIPELRKLLEGRQESYYNLIYCGDMKYEEERQVEKILKMVGSDLGMKANKITAQESNDTRRRLLKDFGSGDIQALVAIKCLDEGVDVPRTETAFILASSSNPRQFIQRRGRVLRLAEGKKEARIFDFLTIPPLPSMSGRLDSENFNRERQLVKNELARVDEFARVALNNGEILKTLRDIKIKLNLMDH
jgi:DNA phosphorothioation system restriction enzyme